MCAGVTLGAEFHIDRQAGGGWSDAFTGISLARGGRLQVNALPARLHAVEQVEKHDGDAQVHQSRNEEKRHLQPGHKNHTLGAVFDVVVFEVVVVVVVVDALLIAAANEVI